MLFNSIDFAIFLPIVFVIYWFFTNNNLKLQNFFIIVASYIFYGWWNWKFLVLIFCSTTIDFFVGFILKHEENNTKRKVLLWVSIVANLGILGYFKYSNFFIENFIEAFSFFGIAIKAHSLSIILPVGISFYTFQTLSYSIDVYKRKLEPTNNFIAFAAYVSFFPQLVAGPIERAINLLPQFCKKRKIDYSKAVDGMRQILWGLFKKVVVADNCAELVNEIFNNSTEMNASTLLLGAFLFAFQIYGDFSGYSDIAIGTARLFGFNLMQNFNFPYFSRNVAEFWRKWHISLTTWFRDYLYIPLGGSKGTLIMTIRNVFIIFIISGFWHGANWTFIIWGALHAIFFLPLIVTENNRKYLNTVAKNTILPSFKELFQILITFSLVVFGWIFFRANNIHHAINYIIGIFSSSVFNCPNIPNKPEFLVLQTVTIVFTFIIIEWIGRNSNYAIEHIFSKYRIARHLFYFVIALLVFILGNFNKTEFIYFAF